MKKLIAIVMCVAMLAACNDETKNIPQQNVVQQQPQAVNQPVQQAPVQAAPQPVIINQAPAQQAHSGIDTGDVALGALAGFAAGHMMNSGSRAPVAPVYNQPRTVVVNRYVTNKTVIREAPRSTSSYSSKPSSSSSSGSKYSRSSRK